MISLLNRIPTLPIVILFSISLGIFAWFTTVIAFSVLLFRVALVYIDLAIAVIPYYLQGGARRILADPASQKHTTASSPPPSVARRRRRRTSSSSTLSATGSLTPVRNLASRSDSYVLLSSPNSVLGLSASVGPTRDFEGVGGWRLDNPSDEDEGLWTKINSRLELPANYGRRHKRSLTSGCVPQRGEVKWGRRDGEDATIMNTGRTRTPPTVPIIGGGFGDGYFASPRQNSPKHDRRAPSLGATSNESPTLGLTMKKR
ncbi:uncharacterized protein BP5553_06360 [Venustampulla echinocandica]|uniref:Uncharacterized protein n=1 Tax=Venustampulla echinocandica TaxID=2656787 RepID=A0A370TJP5_9HELO|nr:uncharacterized protein BP5553_06360 [Venustampulla echinocandica]RDL35748.1 hypothetical protein BP5553_06360 [Venustampulla echinocandica]